MNNIICPKIFMIACMSVFLFLVAIAPTHAFLDEWEESWEDVNNGFWIFGDVSNKEKSVVNDYLKITRSLSPVFQLVLESTLMRMELKQPNGFSMGPSFLKIGDFNDIFVGPFLSYDRPDNGRWYLYSFIDNMIEDDTDIQSWFLRGIQPLGARGRFVLESFQKEQEKNYSLPYLLSSYREEGMVEQLIFRLYYQLDGRHRVVLRTMKERSSTSALWVDEPDRNQIDHVRNWMFEPSVIRKISRFSSLKFTYKDTLDRKITNRPGGATQVPAQFRIDHRTKRYLLEFEHVRTPSLIFTGGIGVEVKHDLYRSLNAADRHLSNRVGVTVFGCEIVFLDQTKIRLTATSDADQRIDIDVMTLF